MDIVFSGKGISINPAIRSYTENKLGKLTRLVSDIIDIQVTLSVQKYLQIVDITVKSSNGGFTAAAQTTDMYASVNEAVDNLLKQVRRSSRRAKSHKGRRRPDRAEVWEETSTEAAGETPAGPKVLVERLPVKPMSVEEATMQISASENNFIVFRNSTGNALNILYRRRDGDLGLIEPEL